MINTGAAQQPQPQFSPLSPAMCHPQLTRFRHSCEHCRKRKIKCSGIRPICDHCKKRGIECIYKPQAKSSRRPGSGTSSPLIGGGGGGSSRPGSGFRQPARPQGLGGSIQPISIPAANPYLHLPLAASPLHATDARYASAPVHTVSPLITGMYGLHTAPHSGSGSGLRPASALPPHMSVEAGGSKDDMFASIQSPQMASMFGYSPADSGGSVYSDTPLDGSWPHDAKPSPALPGHRPATADPASASAAAGANQYGHHPDGALFMQPSFGEPQTAPAGQTSFSFAAPPMLPSAGQGAGYHYNDGDDSQHQRSLGGVHMYQYQHQQNHDHHMSSSLPAFAAGSGAGFPDAGLQRADIASSLAKAGLDESAYLDLISSMGAIPHGFGDADDASGAFGAFVDVDGGGGDYDPPPPAAAMDVDPANIAPDMTMLGGALVAARAVAKSDTASTSAGSRHS
ncbi:hypothetical protein H4R19_003090 [Coemansia spiralis]|nr:hypothetical protein H4R19_003090 [Coemansia spiralis]